MGVFGEFARFFAGRLPFAQQGTQGFGAAEQLVDGEIRLGRRDVVRMLLGERDVGRHRYQYMWNFRRSSSASTGWFLSMSA